MAEETILTWNVTNWITVILMAAVGFAVLAVILRVVNRQKASVTA